MQRQAEFLVVLETSGTAMKKGQKSMHRPGAHEGARGSRCRHPVQRYQRNDGLSEPRKLLRLRESELELEDAYQ